MRSARTLLPLSVLVLALGSCGLFTASPFPVMLTQTIAQRSFVAEIPDTALDNFRPWVVENGPGSRLVLLVGGFPYPSSNPWMFVMDEDLQLIQSYTLTDLQTMVAPKSFNGSQVMVASDGRLVVGTAVFLFGDGWISTAGHTDAMADAGGFYDPGFPLTTAGNNLVNMNAVGNTLQWHTYQCCWLDVGPGSRTITAASINFELRTVLSEPYPAMTDVILVLSERDSDRTRFVRVPRNDFNGALPANFMDLPAYPSFTKEHIHTDTIGYTTSGIVAYSYETQDYTLFTFNEPENLTTLHVGNIDDEKDNQRTAWSWSGGYSCVWDTRTKTLYKVAKWWN
jgi:hypothetical protein